jgi:hypothetical protein
MSIDWKAIARARDLAIPDADLDVIAPRMDSIEAVLEPLALQLKPDQEPAVAFRADVETK